MSVALPPKPGMKARPSPVVAVDAERDRGNKIAAAAHCERGVMKQARKIAVARAFRTDAVAARAVCGKQFRDAAGQRVIGTSAIRRETSRPRLRTGLARTSALLPRR